MNIALSRPVFVMFSRRGAGRMGDEEINDALGGSAHTEQPSIVGILTTDVLEETKAYTKTLAFRVHLTVNLNSRRPPMAFSNRIHGLNACIWVLILLER